MHTNYQDDYGKPLFVEGSIALYQEMKSPPIRWLIDGVLKERGIGMLYGSSGAMKSYAAVDLACRMANGMDFHGRSMEGGAVIYIAGEAAEETNERITAWVKYHGKGVRPYVCPWAVNISDSEQMANLTTIVQRVGNVKLVILDNLADCSVGVKLNEPDDVGEHIKPAMLSFVKESKAAALILHHTGHDKGHERGARVLRDMTDTTIYAAKQQNNFDLDWTLQKVRRGQNGEKLHFHFRDVSEIVGIDNVGVMVTGKRQIAKKEEAPAQTATPEIREFKNASARLESYVEDHGGSVVAVEAQIALGWRGVGDNKPKQTFYDALKGSQRIQKQGERLILIPESSESLRKVLAA